MISRRRLLVGGAVGGSLVMTAGAAFWWRGHPVEGADHLLEQLQLNTGLGEEFDNLLRTLHLLTDVGEHWLAGQNPPPSLAELSQLLSGTLNMTLPIEQALEQRILDDFAHERWCDLAGWRLSETECRLAGLRQLGLAAYAENQPLLAEYHRLTTAQGYRDGRLVPVKYWGPQHTEQGTRFNEQRGGHSAFWIGVDNPPNHLVMTLDNTEMRTVIAPGSITAALALDFQERILNNPGHYEVALVDPLNNIRQLVGSFEVRASRQDSEEPPKFCEITRWGPNRTRAGFAENPQPDGSMGVWVHTRCLPEGVRVYLDDDRLPLVRTDFGFTTAIAQSLLDFPGEKELYLRMEDPEQRWPVGTIVIESP